MSYTREQILARTQRRYLEVDGYRIQSLTATEVAMWEAGRIDWDKGRVTAESLATSKPRLLALCLVDDDGQRLFKDHEYGLIAHTDASILSIYDACVKHCNIESSLVDEERKN